MNDEGSLSWNWDELQKLAYGSLGMKPNEFWELIPSEFLLMVDAFNEAEERKWDNYQHILAWHAANIMNAAGNLKRPVSIDQLLNKKKKAQKMDKEIQKQKLNELKKQFGFD